MIPLNTHRQLKDLRAKIVAICLSAGVATMFALANHLITPETVLAHGGGLDRYGCHRNNREGNYHCHRGPCSGSTFGSQAAMLQAPCANPGRPPQKVTPK